MNKLWMASMAIPFVAACQSNPTLSPQEITAQCNTVVKGETVDPGVACFHNESSLHTAVQFGDSVSKGYSIPARHDLCGVVDYRHDNWDRENINLCGKSYNGYHAGLVINQGNNNGYSTTLLEAMETHLNGKHFNLVLFNSGYHDVQHNSGAHVTRVSEYDYRNNLEAISQVCEQSADICIWVDTPTLDADELPLGSQVVSNSDVLRYNAIAHSIAREHGFYILSVGGKNHDGSVHFTGYGYDVIGKAIAQCVLIALQQGRSDSCHR